MGASWSDAPLRPGDAPWRNEPGPGRAVQAPMRQFPDGQPPLRPINLGGRLRRLWARLWVAMGDSGSAGWR
jgi:hypothetical protein